MTVTNISKSVSAFESQSRVRFTVPFSFIEPLFALLDCSTIVVASATSGAIYHSVLGGNIGDNALFNAGLGLVTSLTYVSAAHFFDLYRLNQLLEEGRDVGRVWASWCVAILLLAVVLFLFKSGGDASRGSVVCLFVLGGAGLVLARWLGRRGLRAALLAGTIRGPRAVVIGTNGELAQFARGDLLTRFGLDEVERVSLPRSETATLPSMSSLHGENLMKRIREASAEEIVLALPWSNPQEIELLLRQLRVIPLPVRLLPDRAASTVLRRQTSMPQRLYMVEVQRAPLSAVDRIVKRMLDVTVAATALALLTPLLAAAAVAIKLESKGPVIFRQRRHGFNGRPFVIYKFRTMKVQEDGGVVVQATKQDPRVTRIGRVLRQTSIDELPQLLNVLQGHMSIVGPRPHALVHDYEYGSMIANYAFRHHVKPGITGWAQVHGYRGETPRLELMERRVALDLSYIDNWSLMLDIRIMLKTLVELTWPRNAY